MSTSHEKEADLLLDKNQIRVLFSDNHILGVHKPAGLSTQSDGRTEDLLSICREYVRIRFQKPGKAFLGLVHRLDRPVEGVVIFGRTSKGAARLSEQFRNHTVKKTYHALVEGTVTEDAGTWTDTLTRQTKGDAPGRRASRADFHSAPDNSREARLHFRTLFRKDEKTLLEIILDTGRLHQARFQCASRGFPIEGDADYGASKAGGKICLAAVALEFDHPVTGERISIQLDRLPAWAEKNPRL